MDSQFYGMPYYIDEIEARLKKLTSADVNAAIKKYLSTDNYEAVLVTANAQQLKETLQKDEPSPKTYNSPVDADVTEADKKIVPLKVRRPGSNRAGGGGVPEVDPAMPGVAPEAPTSTSTPCGTGAFLASRPITATAGRGSAARAGRSAALQPTTISAPSGRRKR